ncbi:MotE family protein [Oceanibacterium hippocampi]|uniref:Magnesium transporter MgtE intracellular domain-containing protein n=1 Tax=Oceanibacterium hippocampi TaxID=745714 RepID=A0A1Y5TYR4_9PROT|nr:hypothetical protein [Oceanibacterium hippocampi]SLN77127.1 hypothetical protein OCH7691_04289 [Oceanibacterium hippocampi]
MLTRIRLLPLVIFASAFLFVLKLGVVWDDTIALTVAVPEAAASSAAPEEEKKNEAAQGDSPAGEGKAAEKEMPAPAIRPAPAGYTESEIDVLGRLSARRAELDERAGDLDMREQLLNVTEARIDDKIAELKKIEETIRGLLKQHDAEKDAQMAALVKVYEKMKPKDAARIFNSLEMPILIEMAERMSGIRFAPVLAAMDQEKAKELTVELATRRQLPGESNSG